MVKKTLTGALLELSEKFCDNFRISGRSFGQTFGFPYTFYAFSLLPQLKIGEVSQLRETLSPKSHSRITSELRIFSRSKKALRLNLGI